MTTKEFQRRLQYFATLNRAAIWFKMPQCQSIFKKTLIFINGSIIYDYGVKVETCDMDADFCKSVWFDRFSREEFEIQYKYFLAFVNRLSKHQFSVMLAQSKELGLTHLLEYSAINNDCK